MSTILVSTLKDIVRIRGNACFNNKHCAWLMLPQSDNMVTKDGDGARDRAREIQITCVTHSSVKLTFTEQS